MQDYSQQTVPPPIPPGFDQPGFPQQQQPQPQPKPKPKMKKTTVYWIIAAVVLVVAILLCLSYFGGVFNSGKTSNTAIKTPATTTPQTTTPPVTTPPVSTPATQPPSYTPPATTPSTPTTTPSTPATTPPVYTPPPPSPEPEPTTSTSSGVLITRQAYQMVLSLSDMGAGWMSSSASAASRQQTFSSSHVVYTKGSPFTPIVQNTVYVFRTEDAAIAEYNSEKPANMATLSISNPSIGDESFLNDTVPTNKLLVFRKSNVVVLLQLQQDKDEDPVRYAQIIEGKITP